MLAAAKVAIDHMLKPAGAAGVAEALMPMLMTQAIPNLSQLPEKIAADRWLSATVDEYARHLGGYPVDILKASCDAHVRSGNEFFPKVFEITRRATPALELRKREQWRIGQLIEATNRPKQKPTAEPFVQEPEHVRLLTILKWQEKPGSNLYSPTKARETRHRLAELGVDAGEMPADVANAPLPSPPVQVEPPPKVGAFKSASLAAASALAPPSQSSVDLTRARAAFWKRQGRDELAYNLRNDADAMATNREAAWRAGEPVYQHPAEEPPAPDAIPEGES